MFLMCEDIDYSVCESAIELMARLTDFGLLDRDEIASLFELVFALNKQVAFPVCISHTSLE